MAKFLHNYLLYQVSKEAFGQHGAAERWKRGIDCHIWSICR